MFGGPSGSVDDPVLGTLDRRDGQWQGQLRWSHSRHPFALTVDRPDTAPTAEDRATFEALARDYPALRAGLEDALYRLWDTARDCVEAPPDISGSLELWSRMEVQGVALRADGCADLIYGLTGDSPVEGVFVVSVRGHEVTPVEYVE
jgi:hypothetical protein